MSWRGEAGGIEAAKQKHQVIMTPGSHVYFDHAQSTREDSITIGGYTSIDKVYSYEPIPKELTAEEGKYVLGAQANLWTEYIHGPSKVEYQIFPRMSALSEVLWSPKESRDWKDFQRRLPLQFKRYDLWGANYSKAYYDINSIVSATAGNKGITLKLEGRDPKDQLVYVVNNHPEPVKYTVPITISENSTVQALYYKNGKLMDSMNFRFNVNKATGKEITLKPEASTYYSGSGSFTLVDGIINEKGGRTSESLGFQTDAEATIDLGTSQEISRVTVHALQSGGTYVYPPKAIEVFGSTDGITFEPFGSSTPVTDASGIKAIATTAFKPTSVRYVRVMVRNQNQVPAGQRGEGEKTWIFLDEVQID